MRKTTIYGLIIIAATLLLMLPQADAESPARTSDQPGSPAGVHNEAPGTHTRAVGTIQYDNDTPFRRLPNTDDLVGNRFTGMADPHSIASVSFRLAQNYDSQVNMSIWEPNTGQATRLRQSLLSGVPSTTVTGVVVTHALVTPITGHGGSFIAGIHNTAYTGLGCPSNSNLNGTCDGVALTAGAPPKAGQQAFHGAYINLAGGDFTPPTTNVASTGVNLNANAIFRVTGDNLPVELMSFSAE
ncbi:MAG: hypothetical protein DRJ65_04610 [Acidobacteria bacterium]|nr:MAG: hypothetical protein DRJ65_04610 [Acidobacteriota bacterium]